MGWLVWFILREAGFGLSTIFPRATTTQLLLTRRGVSRRSRSHSTIIPLQNSFYSRLWYKTRAVCYTKQRIHITWQKSSLTPPRLCSLSCNHDKPFKKKKKIGKKYIKTTRVVLRPATTNRVAGFTSSYHKESRRFCVQLLQEQPEVLLHPASTRKVQGCIQVLRE